MSFWIVPPNRFRGMPVRSAMATYMANTTAAGPLIVIDVVTFPRSIASNRSAMSANVSMATPARPTSPNAIGSSESQPNRVGMSNAVDNPVPPDRNSSLNLALVSSAVPNPANWRIVHNFDRYMDAYGPRVYGNWPGSSAPSGPYTGANGTPDIVSKSASRNLERRYASSHSDREPIPSGYGPASGRRSPPPASSYAYRGSGTRPR